MRLVCGFLLLFPALSGCVLTVNTNVDGDDGQCNAKHCSLREALNATNASSFKYTIRFDIPPASINLTSQLPTITEPVVIDGTSQPGYAGSPLVAINGQGSFLGIDGLIVQAADCEIRGLKINNFWGDGVRLEAGNAKLVGNHITTNHSRGVYIVSANNTVGGTTAAERNVISNNVSSGIEIDGAAATGNVIQGNYIGTDETGMIAWEKFDPPGNHDGIDIYGADQNVVGGTEPGAGNVISGNWARGMYVSGDDNVIQGNLIGVGADRVKNIYNNWHGVTVVGSGNLIGGTVAGAGNVIAHNHMSGVEGESVNEYRRNSIFSNVDLGIDLDAKPNDSLDLDGVQNYPVIASAANESSMTNIEGTLSSSPLSSFVIEFFSSTSCDPSGRGEGAVFVGDVTVTSNGSGIAPFAAAITPQLTSGDIVTATATLTNIGRTSEFSACVTVE